MYNFGAAKTVDFSVKKKYQQQMLEVSMEWTSSLLRYETLD
jgi:hypothetical protein